MAGHAYKGSVLHGKQLGQHTPVTDGIGRLPGFAAVVGVGAVQGRVHFMAAGAEDTYDMSGFDFNAVRFAVSLCIYIGDGIGLHIRNGGEKRESVAAVFGQNTPGTVQIKIISTVYLKVGAQSGVLFCLAIHGGKDVSVGELDESIGNAAGVAVAGISPAQAKIWYIDWGKGGSDSSGDHIFHGFCPVYTGHKGNMFLAKVPDGIVNYIVEGQGIKGAILKLDKAVCFASALQGKGFPAFSAVCGVQGIRIGCIDGKKDLSITGTGILVGIAAAAYRLVRKSLQRVFHKTLRHKNTTVSLGDSIAGCGEDVKLFS